MLGIEKFIMLMTGGLGGSNNGEIRMSISDKTKTSENAINELAKSVIRLNGIDSLSRDLLAYQQVFQAAWTKQMATITMNTTIANKALFVTPDHTSIIKEYLASIENLNKTLATIAPQILQTQKSILQLQGTVIPSLMRLMRLL